MAYPASGIRQVLVLFLFLFIPFIFAFKNHDFKTCSQSGFCRRGRALSARASIAGPTNWISPYSIDRSTVSIKPDQPAFLSAKVKSSLYPNVQFELDVRVHEDGVTRVRMDEVGGLRKRYDEAASWALIREPQLSGDVRWVLSADDARAVYGGRGGIAVVVTFEPLKITVLKDGKEQVVLNGRGLLHMEHFRVKEEPPRQPTDEEAQEGAETVIAETVLEVNQRAWFEGENQDAWWEETWQTWTDAKPKGPESLSLDIEFPNHPHVYGIPQHATRLSLPTTSGDGSKYSDPYRLYNADVFEYLADSPVSLYGSIPLMHAHSPKSTVAIFNALASETWVDVSHPSNSSTDTHWISESGILDVFILPGPTPADIFAQYSRLTGTPVLPAHWALGYHQCRWNYVSSDDVRTVQKRFDEEDMPVDVFWLDIEYAEEHKYFIWEKKRFPDSVEMVNDVSALSRKMVVIIDPHLKRTEHYPVYKDASDREVLVKPKSGEGEYEGWCWSGSSSWVDFFNPHSWVWWKNLFKTVNVDGQFSWSESTDSVHIWNDMNEPSVFNGPEITMPKDNVHYGGWEHRDVHNINGMLFSNTTYHGIMERSDPPKRPFVLTRSFYAGSQRFGAMWTGDNMGTWEHMTVGIKMVLANGIAGMSFAGSDVGGFFGNPDPEMLVRWYQVGAFGPFFRAHAHIDTKRREPYLLAEPHKSIVGDILRLRYSLLPLWYTAFRETTVTGLPVLRPQFVMFPQDEAGFGIDDQFYIGSSGLLVKPVTAPGVTETSVYLAEDQIYYDFFNAWAYHGSAEGKHVVVPSELDQIPVLVRGGSIIPTRERLRRSSPLMKQDPFTLSIALDKNGTARGELYLDDGESYAHRQGGIVWRQFAAQITGTVLSITNRDLVSQKLGEAVDGVVFESYDPENAFAKSIDQVRIERVIISGMPSPPFEVRVREGAGLVEWGYTTGVAYSDGVEGNAAVLVLKDPKIRVMQDWEIVIHW